VSIYFMSVITMNKAVVIVNSLIIIGIAVMAAKWTWNAWQPETSANPSQKIIAKIQSANRPLQQVNHLKVILSANLFGQKKASLKKEIKVLENIKKSTQNLKLQGIFHYPNQPEKSYALITVAGKIAKGYRVNEDLVGAQGKIHAILKDRVQIERNGDFEKIELSKLGNSSGFSVSKQTNNFKQNLRDNPTALLRKLGLKKTPRGISFAGKNQRLPLGLKKSDIITTVNGYDFEEVTQNPEILEELLNSDKLEAEIQRGGRQIFVKVPNSLLKQWRKAINKR